MNKTLSLYAAAACAVLAVTRTEAATSCSGTVGTVLLY